MKADNRSFLIITFVFDSVMLFYNLLPSLITAVLLAFYVVLSLVILNKNNDRFVSLLYLSLGLIPVSYISVLGTSTIVFPISWFHVLIVSLFISITINNGIDRKYLFWICLFLVYGLINSLFQPLKGDGIKQVLMIVLFLFTFIIGEYIVNVKQFNLYIQFGTLFLITCLSVSIQIIIQFVFYRFLGLQVGYFEAMAGRIAYGGLLSDFSFATLYLACGFMLTIILFFDYREFGVFKFSVIEALLLIAILITSARTGLYALVICIVIYFVLNIDFKAPQKTQMIILICGVLLIPIALYVIFKSRGGQGLFDDSGRTKGYKAALDLFFESPVFGAGFGLNNLTNMTKLEVPHNYFIQYLSQSGVVGTVLISIPIVKFVYERLRYIDNTKYVFILIVIGAMAIPDIVCSRFLFAVVIMSYFAYVRSEDRGAI